MWIPFSPVLRRSSRRRPGGAPAGISVIEVLTAIVVALIGLSGVLLMIPLAARQAQVGMDTEKAVNLARNAAAELEIRDVISREIPLTGTLAAPQLLPNATSRCFLLDPEGVFTRMQSGADAGSYPFLSPQAVTAIAALNAAAGIQGGGADQTVLIQRVTVRDPLSPVAAPLPLRRSLARGLFQWTDDLQVRTVTDAEFADPLLNPAGPGQYLSKDLVLPIQQFEQSATAGGLNLNGRRQNLGEMSWTVLIVPSVFSPALNLAPPPAVATNPACPGYPDPVPRNQLIGAEDRHTGMRIFHLVYKKRPQPVVVNDPLADPQPYDRVYQVDWPGTDLADPSFRHSYNGGMLKLREENVATPQNPAIPVEIAQSNAASRQRAEIRRGDWIGLTNVHYDYVRTRFVQEWNFYRVTNATLDTDLRGLHWAVMLEGPEWDFQRPYSVDTSLSNPVPVPLAADTAPTFSFGTVRITGAAPVFTYIPTSTLAVHLPDVWTVHERTVSIGSD